MHRRPQQILGTLLATAALAFAAAGCGGDGDDGGGSQADHARKGGTLTVLAVDDVDSLDPGISYYQFGFMILNDVHRRLYAYEPDDPEHPVPDLAAGDPEISADGRSVIVKLRDGVRFGPPVDREVTSADVKYAVERGFTKNVSTACAAPYFGTLVGVEDFQAGKAAEIAGLETPDERTIVFRTTVGGPLANALVLPITAPVPKEHAARFDAKRPSTYARHQVATGPYMLQARADGTVTGYKPGRSITLVRNPNWDRGRDFRPAHLDRIEVQEGNHEIAAASRRILLGKGLVSGDFGPEPPTLRAFYERRKPQFSFSPGSNVRYVTLNTKIAPLDDLDVRKAVLAGIDREALRLVRGGAIMGPVATHFIYPGNPGFDEAGGTSGPDLDFNRNPKGDLAVAAKYCRAAGYASGRYEGDDEVLMVGPAGGSGQATSEVAQAQLERLGFKVRLRLAGQDTLVTKFLGVPRARVNVSPTESWIRDFADPQSILDPTFNGDNIRASGNVTCRSSSSRRSTPRCALPGGSASRRSAPARGAGSIA